MSGVDTENFIEDIYDKPIIWNRNCISNKALTEKTWVELSKKYRTSIPTLKAKWKGLRDMFRVEIKRIPRSTSGEMMVEPHEYESKWTHYKSLLFLVDHMRSRNSSNFSAMDPIQKMEILESYPYMLHGLSQQHQPNQSQPDENGPSVDASSDGITETIKTEPLDTCDVVNGNGNGNSNSNEKSNEQKTENSATDSPNGGGSGDASKFAESSNGSGGASDANANGAKRRKCSAADASASTSEENGDGKGVNDDYHFLMSMQPFMSELSLAQKLRLRMKIQKLVFDELYGCYNDLRT